MELFLRRIENESGIKCTLLIYSLDIFEGSIKWDYFYVVSKMNQVQLYVQGVNIFVGYRCMTGGYS